MRVFPTIVLFVTIFYLLFFYLSIQGGLRHEFASGTNFNPLEIRDKTFSTHKKGTNLLAGRDGNVATITIDTESTYQKVHGFGGAFTGAVSYNLNQLSKNLQDHIFRLMRC